ncbi:histidine phosphatase superfamily [Papiliotrema laurentii]|uniref:Histidine phosphatase superfamily n=1 Tax=Papiliotrema laurentii TaxID=5418 RepID=A0AAD9L7B3_PAPLA|nr:histidine phosphatase superfamily [Papiliotrema laurentii]
MITLTIVRHGESTDNLRPVWAGWADAPLSVHGMNQAKALGESYRETRVDAIYASDLLRALWTAQQIERNQPDPKPAFTVSPLLREQHFGVAEGKPWGEKGGFNRGPGRTFKFPEGESLEDVRNRANEAISKFIEQHLEECRGKPAKSRHVVVVAHGIFNSEFLGALLARRAGHAPLEWSYRGMTNTGWTRSEIGYAEEAVQVSSPDLETHPSGPLSPTSVPDDPPPMETPESDRLQPLVIRILCADVTTHLEGVHRQKGGIGSSSFDANQSDLRKFFGGGAN